MPLIAHTDTELPYWLYLPENVDSRDDWPLIVFLHGSGERGTDLNLVLKYSMPKYLHEAHEVPFIVLIPQCPENSKWDLMTDTVIELVETIISTQAIDDKRVYLTGFSMGGRGTWAIALDYPEKFAALAPVSGRIPPREAFLDKVESIKDIPIWVFHGAKDDIVEVENSDQIVKKLREYNASNLSYTRYEDADHGGASNLTYWNEELYTWFLKWSR